MQSSWQGIIGSEKQLATKATVNLDIYRNNSIKPPEGGLFKTRPSRGGGAYSRGHVYSKGSFPEGGLIRDAYYVSKEAEFSPKKLSKL